MTDPSKFETDLKTTMDATLIKNADNIHAVFNLAIKGNYDLVNKKFDQNTSFNYSLTGTGPIPVEIEDLISIDWGVVTGD